MLQNGGMRHCHKCGTEVFGLTKVGRREECDKCGAALHACKNCKFHDPFAQNECKEPGTEFVRDREEANFCDYFDFRHGKPGEDPAKKAKDALEALFKK